MEQAFVYKGDKAELHNKDIADRMKAAEGWFDNPADALEADSNPPAEIIDTEPVAPEMDANGKTDADSEPETPEGSEGPDGEEALEAEEAPENESKPDENPAVEEGPAAESEG